MVGLIKASKQFPSPTARSSDALRDWSTRCDREGRLALRKDVPFLAVLGPTKGAEQLHTCAELYWDKGET